MKTHTLKFFLPSIFIALFIAYGSLTSGDNPQVMKLFQIEIPDKLIHGFFYFLLSLSIFYPIARFRENINFSILAALILIFLYGVLIEIIQYLLIEGRSGDVYDVLANAAGIFIAVVAVKLYKKY